MGEHGAELLTWYLGASRARTSAQPEKARGSTAHAAGFGEKWRELSVRYDPDSFSWKTHRCLWDEDLSACSLTLPKWGLMRDGVLSERMTLVLHTAVTDAGLWPTPQAMEATNDLKFTCSGDGREKPNKLGWAIARAMWQTPVADDACNRAAGKWSSRGEPKLSAQVMWPTPKANDAEKRGNFDTSNPRNGLPAAAKAWPTPTVNDSRNSTLPPSQAKHDNIPGALLRDGEMAGGQLNPTWVEWLMGWPLGWTDLKPLETDRCRNAQQRHGVF
jgi:hypothetical protein